ncbi:MAG: maleylpyruvate isomerase family mycothiol-dependent enzyme [Actinomycetota bacterium]
MVSTDCEPRPQSHAERLDAARRSVEYICSRSPEQMLLPVPNCPGWTVYNAAVHIGRVGVAWRSMILATPDDPESRTRGYADAEARGTGHPPHVLQGWAIAAIDALDDDTERSCYFSMTGGEGTVALWAWHAASELAVHRLDVESALDEPHTMSATEVTDALDYACSFFLPAMARVTGREPDRLDVVTSTGARFQVGADAEAAVTLRGDTTDLLLAVWGRPHGDVAVDGDPTVLERWRSLPGEAFQFGTWD